MVTPSQKVLLGTVLCIAKLCRALPDLSQIHWYPRERYPFSAVKETDNGDEYAFSGEIFVIHCFIG